MCSVESLPDELREYFEMLTVFDYDIAIPVKVFETIWDLDEFDAEENMNGNDCNLIFCESIKMSCVELGSHAHKF